MRNRIRCCGALAIVALFCAGCSQSATVKLSYVSEPRAQLANGGSSAVRIAVKPISANWSVHEANGNALLPAGPIGWTWTFEDSTGARRSGSYTFAPTSETYGTTDARLWGNKLRSAIMELIRRHGGRRVQIVERERMDLMWDEIDYKLAGAVESRGNPEDTRWSDVDVFVVGNIEGRTTMRQEIERPNRALSIPVRFVPIIGGPAAAELSRPKPRYQRTITIAGNLRLVDAATGRTWAVHEISSQTLEDEKSYPFKDASRLSMAPEEQIIRRLLDDEVKRFCAEIVPVEFNVAYQVKSSGNDDSQLGVKFLRAGDDEQACSAFDRATAADAHDHRSYFGAGVACERMGRLDEACNHYRSALMSADEHDIDPDDDEAQYERALLNVEQRLRGRNSGSALAGSFLWESSKWR